MGEERRPKDRTASIGNTVEAVRLSDVIKVDECIAIWTRVLDEVIGSAITPIDGEENAQFMSKARINDILDDRNYIFNMHTDFVTICHLIGFEPDAVVKGVRKIMPKQIIQYYIIGR